MAKVQDPAPAEDLLVPTTAPETKPDVLAWLTKNNKVVIGMVVAAVLSIAGYLGWNAYQADQNNVAADEMVAAVGFFEQDSLDKALRGTSQYQGFETLVEDYGSTKAGNLCKYYLGIIYLKKGKYSEGVAMLESFSKGNDLVSMQAYYSLGYGYEELKEWEQAASAYERAATTKENKFTTPYYLMQAARVLEYAGNNDKALAHYKRIKKDYPTSTEGSNIDKYIAKLETGE